MYETNIEFYHKAVTYNGDGNSPSMRVCMFCQRNLASPNQYRYCSTELLRKSDSLICYKCEEASKKGKLKEVIEKLRDVLKSKVSSLHIEFLLEYLFLKHRKKRLSKYARI